MVETARIVSTEGAALVERQTSAVLGDIKKLTLQIQVGQRHEGPQDGCMGSPLVFCTESLGVLHVSLTSLAPYLPSLRLPSARMRAQWRRS